ncbi:MAG: hypothetical protein CSB21_01840 [Deltaproteobacteria bacterium]|nr:MAG: hypothetical protein CSB21_01840 [Deltaproteobacteria bacterium]
MADKIKTKLNVESKIIPGERGIFDVKINNDIIYSKSETGEFPNEDELVNKIITDYVDK